MKRCARCLLPETHETLIFDEKGVCNVCHAQETKADKDWNRNLGQLDELINTHRGRGRYDCIVPFSGGKDSTWTLYFLMKRYQWLNPLVVRFNHGFLRDTVRHNTQKTCRQLGVAFHEFTPDWNITKRLMLRSFLEKGDFCWHCHTGIFAYPMQVALKEDVPLIIWGEPSAEYTAYYNYDVPEEVDENRFNRFVNLGISAEDMALRLEGVVEEEDLSVYTYPEEEKLKALGVRSICLGSYIPWDVKKQVEIIKRELDWQGDAVENVPPGYDYEKIECWMQGVRDYIKYIKRGYSRASHLVAIDLRNERLDQDTAKKYIETFDGKRPPSLDLFLEYLGIDENEFITIAASHSVAPWRFEDKTPMPGEKTPDFDQWGRGQGLTRAETEEEYKKVGGVCSNFCGKC
jgi:N-acetyl sugar amidotransferase